MPKKARTLSLLEPSPEPDSNSEAEDYFPVRKTETKKPRNTKKHRSKRIHSDECDDSQEKPQKHGRKRTEGVLITQENAADKFQGYLSRAAFAATISAKEIANTKTKRNTKRGPRLLPAPSLAPIESALATLPSLTQITDQWSDEAIASILEENSMSLDPYHSDQELPPNWGAQLLFNRMVSRVCRAVIATIPAPSGVQNIETASVAEFGEAMPRDKGAHIELRRRSANCNPPSIMGIPVEIATCICKFLPPESIIALSSTCKRLRFVLLHDVVWRPIVASLGTHEKVAASGLIDSWHDEQTEEEIRQLCGMYSGGFMYFAAFAFAKTSYCATPSCKNRGNWIVAMNAPLCTSCQIVRRPKAIRSIESRRRSANSQLSRTGITGIPGTPSVAIQDVLPAPPSMSPVAALMNEHVLLPGPHEYVQKSQRLRRLYEGLMHGKCAPKIVGDAAGAVASRQRLALLKEAKWFSDVEDTITARVWSQVVVSPRTAALGCPAVAAREKELRPFISKLPVKYITDLFRKALIEPNMHERRKCSAPFLALGYFLQQVPDPPPVCESAESTARYLLHGYAYKHERIGYRVSRAYYFGSGDVLPVGVGHYEDLIVAYNHVESDPFLIPAVEAARARERQLISALISFPQPTTLLSPLHRLYVYTALIMSPNYWQVSNLTQGFITGQQKGDPAAIAREILNLDHFISHFGFESRQILNLDHFISHIGFESEGLPSHSIRPDCLALIIITGKDGKEIKSRSKRYQAVQNQFLSTSTPWTSTVEQHALRFAFEWSRDKSCLAIPGDQEPDLTTITVENIFGPDGFVEAHDPLSAAQIEQWAIELQVCAAGTSERKKLLTECVLSSPPPVVANLRSDEIKSARKQLDWSNEEISVELLPMPETLRQLVETIVSSNIDADSDSSERTAYIEIGIRGVKEETLQSAQDVLPLKLVKHAQRNFCKVWESIARTNALLRELSSRSLPRIRSESNPNPLRKPVHDDLEEFLNMVPTVRPKIKLWLRGDEADKSVSLLVDELVDDGKANLWSPYRCAGCHLAPCCHGVTPQEILDLYEIADMRFQQQRLFRDDGMGLIRALFGDDLSDDEGWW